MTLGSNPDIAALIAVLHTSDKDLANAITTREALIQAAIADIAARQAQIDQDNADVIQQRAFQQADANARQAIQQAITLVGGDVSPDVAPVGEAPPPSDAPSSATGLAFDENAPASGV